MDILPDSRLTQNTHSVKGQLTTPQYKMMLNWVPIFCANCGVPGGYVPEDTCTFAFYWCQPCADSLPPIEGTYVEPDVVFWQKVHDAMVEQYGGILPIHDIVEQLKDGNSMLSKLARERT